MNPVLAVALLALGGVGLSMFMRKKNTVAGWLTRFWARQAQPPAEFIRRMQDGCTWLVDSGQVTSAVGWDYIDIVPEQGSQIRAATDCVVSWVGGIAGRGQALGLSSLQRDPESFMYVGLDPMVGLGQFVTGDEVIGFCRAGVGTGASARTLTFRVLRARMPEPRSTAAVDSRGWLRAHGTYATQQERGW